MLQVILAIHLLTALIIIGLILVQQGKGAEAGASFGAGASQTIFGSAGSWNFFSRMTAIFATIFFITSIALAVIAKNSAVVDHPLPPVLEQTDLPLPTGEQEIPVQDSAETATEIPVVNESPDSATVPSESVDKTEGQAEEVVVPEEGSGEIPEQIQE